MIADAGREGRHIKTLEFRFKMANVYRQTFTDEHREYWLTGKKNKKKLRSMQFLKLMTLFLNHCHLSHSIVTNKILINIIISSLLDHTSTCLFRSRLFFLDVSIPGGIWEGRWMIERPTCFKIVKKNYFFIFWDRGELFYNALLLVLKSEVFRFKS